MQVDERGELMLRKFGYMTLHVGLLEHKLHYVYEHKLTSISYLNFISQSKTILKLPLL